jgi:geranylgeranyl diphosphate synthase type I
MSTSFVGTARPFGDQRIDPAVLDRTFGLVRGLVTPSLRSAAEVLPASVRGVVGYHFGWYDESGRPATGNPGKMLRPAFTLLCAQAVGAPADCAVDAAVAVELTHNFTLLHDDVMDGDATRRHRPTAWKVFGVPAAILAGDALQSLAVEVLAAAPRSVRALCATVRDLIGGQGLDIQFERRDDISLDECLTMVGGKTASLLRCACELGAMHGGGTPAQVSALGRFGWHLGVAFQLIDDLLGIWGDPVVTGKPALADLRARKKSLPVVAALTAGGPASRHLAEFYRRPDPLSERELVAAADLVELTGGRAWAQAEAERHVQQAMDFLTAAEPAGDPGDALAALAALITRRER